MKKALFFLFFLSFLNNSFAQSCIGLSSDPWLCLANNRQNGDVIQMTYENFSNSSVINSLVIEDPTNICDDNMKVKIIRRFHDDEPTDRRASARFNADNPCHKKVVFAGVDFTADCSASNPCNDSLFLFVEIIGSPLGFDVPAAAMIPCDYDKENDPLNLIGFPTNIKGGVISFIDANTETDCINQITFTRTWTILACNGATISKNQNITTLPTNCTFDAPNTFFNLPTIPEGDYYGVDGLLANGTVSANTNVGMFDQTSISLFPGFHATANSNFTAAIATCNVLANDLCTSPIALTCGENVYGSTINSTNSGVSSFDATCDNSNFLQNILHRGVFFSILGEGKSIKVSVNNDNTNFDTELRIFEGSCSANTCIAGNDDAISGNTTKSEVVFHAEAGVNYLIYLDGYNNAVGNFQLVTTCFSGELIECGAICGTTVGQDNEFSGAYYDNDNYSISCFGEDFVGKDIGYLWYLQQNTTITLNPSGGSNLSWALIELDQNFAPTGCITPSSGNSGDINDIFDPGYYAIIVDARDANVEGNFQLMLDCPNPFTQTVSNKSLKIKAQATISKPEFETTHNSLDINSNTLELMPNPANLSTQLVYRVSTQSSVKASILDIAGKPIKHLFSFEHKGSGTHTENLNLADYPSGIYMIHLQINAVSHFQKLIIQ